MEEKRQMSEMETSEKWPCDLANLPVAVDILTPLFKIRHETCALALNPRAFWISLLSVWQHSSLLHVAGELICQMMAQLQPRLTMVSTDDVLRVLDCVRAFYYALVDVKHISVSGHT